MGRGKIEIKRIEEASCRQVTFSKRRKGILKKACKLSELYDAQVAVIVFSQKGTLYEFFSSENITDRYVKHGKNVHANKFEEEQHIQSLKSNCASMVRKIELLELSQRQEKKFVKVKVRYDQTFGENAWQQWAIDKEEEAQVQVKTA